MPRRRSCEQRSFGCAFCRRAISVRDLVVPTDAAPTFGGLALHAPPRPERLWSTSPDDIPPKVPELTFAPFDR